MTVGFITVKEAADRAGVHDRTIRRWFDEKRLTKHYTPTRRVRVNETELEPFLIPTPDPAVPCANH
jgi:excisionase family DNA binding protein